MVSKCFTVYPCQFLLMQHHLVSEKPAKPLCVDCLDSVWLFLEFMVGHCNLASLMFLGDVVFPGNKMQIAACWTLLRGCKHARTAHRSHGYRIIWLKLLISCGQTSFTGLSIQIAYNKEMSVQQFACPRRAVQKPAWQPVGGSCLFSFALNTVYMAQ